MKKLFFIIIFCFPVFFGSELVMAQTSVTPDLDSFLQPTSCSSGDKDCYQLLEYIPLETGPINSVNVSASGEEGIAGFLNFMFEIGIGVAGVLGVVMLVIYGFRYAANDNNINTFSVLKQRIYNVILGLLLLLGTFVILNTINPDLLILSPEIKTVEFKVVEQEYLDWMNNMDVSNVTLPSDSAMYSDVGFISYMYHQQGQGGAPAIIWLAKKGYTTPQKNPFYNNLSKLKTNIFNQRKEHMTPLAFLQYNYKRYLAQSQQINKIYSQYAGSIEQAAREIGVNVTMLKIACKMEAAYACEKAGAEKVTNRSGYKGLFQFSDDTFKEQKKRGCDDIFNTLCNSYAGAKYMKYHIGKYKEHMNKM